MLKPFAEALTEIRRRRALGHTYEQIAGDLRGVYYTSAGNPRGRWNGSAVYALGKDFPAPLKRSMPARPCYSR